jgi:hypothetical protein
MENNMKTGVSTILGRRGLLRAVITGAAAAAGITAVVRETTAAKPNTTKELVFYSSCHGYDEGTRWP